MAEIFVMTRATERAILNCSFLKSFYSWQALRYEGSVKALSFCHSHERQNDSGFVCDRRTSQEDNQPSHGAGAGC